jgi:hypothetical protein
MGLRKKPGVLGSERSLAEWTLRGLSDRQAARAQV